MWAEASYPVKVYWAIRSPMPNTIQNSGDENPSPEKPDSFSSLVNTNDTDWWWSGITTSTATISTTPTTCHQTEMSLNSATTRTPNVFNRPCRIMIRP